MKNQKSICGWMAAVSLMSGALLPCVAEVVLPASQAPTIVTSSTNEVILEDDQMQIAFNADSGALTRFEDKAAHWTVERRPELGVSFRLFAPMPARRWNPVMGHKQHATEVKKISDHELHITWENLVGDSSGPVPISLTADITLTNGVLTFNSILKNDSALTVETVDYPYFGDFSAPDRAALLQARVMTSNLPAPLKIEEIYPHFGNAKGYWGVFWPTKMLDAPLGRFCLISTTNAGLYFDYPVSPYHVIWTFEQHPGVLSSLNTLVPPEDEISGTPVHLEFRACHYVFAAPGVTTNLTSVALRCYQGDWHAGFDLYKKHISPRNESNSNSQANP